VRRFNAFWHSIVLGLVAATVSTLMNMHCLFRPLPLSQWGLLNGLLFVLMMSPEIVLAISLSALFLLIGFAVGLCLTTIGTLLFCPPFIVITVFAQQAAWMSA
jgi:spermidine/putrescine transport system permease protein